MNYGNLSEYINQENKTLITKSALGNVTAGYLNIQTGVVGKTRLALLDSHIDSVGDARTCGWTSNGGTNLSQREIDPAPIKIQIPYCTNAMSKYFNNNQVLVALGKAMPFEQQFMDDFVKEANKKMEDIVWNGVRISETDYKGILNIITDASVEDLTAGTTLYDTCLKVYNAVPAADLADTTMFMSVSDYRLLVQELSAKNLFAYDKFTVGNDGKFEMILPSTSMKVVGVPGLEGKNKIIALNTKHTILGVSMTGNAEDQQLKFYFTEVEDEYHLDFRVYMGVQIAFPADDIHWSSTPVRG